MSLVVQPLEGRVLRNGKPCAGVRLAGGGLVREPDLLAVLAARAHGAPPPRRRPSPSTTA
jgi:hypothetical protein